MTTKRDETRNHTFVRLKDSWTYVWRATIARKYIVASVTIVRIKAENLSVLLFRYVYQTMMRNADNSKRFQRPTRRVLGHHHSPNAVAMEFGTNLNWRSMTVTHKCVASTGIGGKFAIVGGLMNAVASDMVNLANASVPK